MEAIKITKKEFADAAAEISVEIMEDETFSSNPAAGMMATMMGVVFAGKLTKKLFGDENETEGQA